MPLIMVVAAKVVLCVLVTLYLSTLWTLVNGNIQEPAVTAEPEESLFEFRDVYPSHKELTSNTSDGRIPLYFGLMMSFGGDVKSSGAIPGVQVALDAINSQPDLLPGYTLHYTLTDSQCKRTDALNGLFDQLLQSPGPKIALIGAGCSVATEPTAEVSHYYNITQISCASSSNELNDRQRFRNYFQLLPTEADIVPIFYAIIKEYRWRRVAIIVQNENRFTVAMDMLRELLSHAKVEVSEKSFNTLLDINNLGNDLFDSDSRIFLLAMFSKQARYILCRAHELGMKYPKHLFLTYGTYESQWWIPPDDEDVHHLCTPEDRARVLEYSFAALHFNFLNEDNLDTVTDTGSGITGRVYNSKYQSLLEKPPFYYTHFDYAPHCYDATWALAFALNETINEISEKNITLTNFTYDKSSSILKTVKKHLQSTNTNFNGISGYVAFNENGTRTVTRQRVLQYRGPNITLSTSSNSTDHDVNATLDGGELKLVNVALLSESNRAELVLQYVEGWNATTVWNGTVPYDGVPRNATLTVVFPLTITYSTLVVIGMVFLVICILFNFIFRNKRLIRLSSPKLNYFIATGAFFYYMDALVQVLPLSSPGATTAICIIDVWLNSFGFSLAIGTILAKIWRVYFIFRNPQLNKKSVQDSHLVAFVLGLLTVDFVILTTYTILEGTLTKYQVDTIPSPEKPESTRGALDVKTHYFINTCSSQLLIQLIVLPVLFGYKGLLQLIALYFAFKTRKVKVKGLDDSKYIAFVVYVFSVFWIIFIVSEFALWRYTNVYAAVVAASALVCATSLLIIVFIPKMVQLYKDPKGNKVFTSRDDGALSQATTAAAAAAVMGGGGGGETTSKTGSEDELRKRIKQLEDQITKLREIPSRNEPPSKVSFELPAQLEMKGY